MSDRPPERWILALDVRDDDAPPAVTMRRLIKHIWRRWRIKCKGFSEDRRLFELMVENERLRHLVDSLTDHRTSGRATGPTCGNPENPSQ